MTDVTENSIDYMIDNLANQIEELKVTQSTLNNQQDHHECKVMMTDLDIQMKNLILDKENVTNVVDKLYNMDINESTAMENYHGKDSKFKKDAIIPFGAKFLPLEVPNVFCYKYFDDEDYVYFTLRIPEEILANISTFKLEECDNEIDLFQNIAKKTRKLIKSNSIIADCVTNNYSNNFNKYYYKYDFLNNEIYYKIITIYINVLKFYYNINTSNLLTWSVFGNNLNNTLDGIFDQMHKEICFSYLENNYKCLDMLHKELIYGLRLIMSQLNIIRNFYRKHNLAFQNYNVKHQNRFIRLLNNFCVLMIFLKFNNIDLGENVTYEDFVRFNMETQDVTADGSLDTSGQAFNGVNSQYYPCDLDTMNTKVSIADLSSARMEDF